MNMRVSLLLVIAMLAGCSSIPSMRYCDKVEYKREGSKIIINAECSAPIGGAMGGF